MIAVARTEVTLALLVGGASTRMGRDKASLDAGGVPLGSLPLRALEPLAGRVLLAGRAVPGLWGEPVGDARPGCGPLGGIVAALDAARTPYVLIAACDMPSIEVGVARLLLDRLSRAPGAQAAVCRSARRLEPLLAAYRREAAAPLRLALDAGHLALADALAVLRTEIIGPRAWRPLDPGGRSFANWNSPGDLPAQTTV